MNHISESNSEAIKYLFWKQNNAPAGTFIAEN